MTRVNRFLLYGLIIGWLLVFVGAGYIYHQRVHLDPKAPATYYKIFDKKAILDGTETTASEVVVKLDRRLDKYHQTFEQMAGTQDEKKLKALFYMNFVHMFFNYGNRTLSEKTFKDLLWGGENSHCGTNTLFLAMLLDRAGYEFRTVSINNNTHGYVCVKFDDEWQILSPTVNVWIKANTEELLDGKPREYREFFLKAADQSNAAANAEITKVVNLKDFMLKLGIGYSGKLDDYNYQNLDEYKY